MEALALSGEPLAACRVAKSYNMNIAKAYKEMKRLSDLGVNRGGGPRPGTLPRRHL